MAHRRPPLVRALQLNTAGLVVEIVAGVGSNSFSLIMDGIHNLSDEVALLLLVLAYSLRVGLSGKLLRYANLFNSVGLLTICAFLVWRSRCSARGQCSYRKDQHHGKNRSFRPHRIRHPS